MKKGFPNTFLGIALGWENLGRIGTQFDDEKDYYQVQIHNFCKTPLNVGKQDGDLFLYCKRCKVKINQND